MGISSNQARFLSLTARQVDLEHRVQQISQRRLRIASELERVATEYNNAISNRQLYLYDSSSDGISSLTISGITGTKDSNGNSYQLIGLNTNDSKYYTITANAIGKTATAVAIGSQTISYTTLGLETSASNAEILDAAIRQGYISIASVADEYTQSAIDVENTSTDYELKDWRTLSFLADELYDGDDAEAETQYDVTVQQINAQDKKLQLEQSSLEVAYKAVTSEKEAVKKILDTNAQASFKYFS